MTNLPQDRESRRRGFFEQRRGLCVSEVFRVSGISLDRESYTTSDPMGEALIAYLPNLIPTSIYTDDDQIVISLHPYTEAMDDGENISTSLIHLPNGYKCNAEFIRDSSDAIDNVGLMFETGSESSRIISAINAAKEEIITEGYVIEIQHLQFGLGEAGITYIDIGLAFPLNLPEEEIRAIAMVAADQILPEISKALELKATSDVTFDIIQEDKMNNRIEAYLRAKV